MNVYPAEVEAVLHEHPDVLDAAVYGLPSPEWGETVHAVVVPRDGHALAIPALEAHVAERLADYKRPRSGRCAPRCRAPSRASSSNASCVPNTTFAGKGIPRSEPGVRSLAVTLTRRGFLASLPVAAVAACGVAAVPGAPGPVSSQVPQPAPPSPTPTPTPSAPPVSWSATPAAARSR